MEGPAVEGKPMSIQAIKDAVRERDGMACTRCGMTNEEHVGAQGRSLHVHRIEPGSAYTLEGCLTLCVRCHGAEPKSAPGTGTGRRMIAADPALYERLAARAAANNRPISWELRVAIEAHLKAAGGG